MPKPGTQACKNLRDCEPPSDRALSKACKASTPMALSASAAIIGSNLLKASSSAAPETLIHSDQARSIVIVLMISIPHRTVPVAFNGRSVTTAVVAYELFDERPILAAGARRKIHTPAYSRNSHTIRRCSPRRVVLWTIKVISSGYHQELGVCYRLIQEPVFRFLSSFTPRLFIGKRF